MAIFIMMTTRLMSSRLLLIAAFAAPPHSLGKASTTANFAPGPAQSAQAASIGTLGGQPGVVLGAGPEQGAIGVLTNSNSTQQEQSLNQARHDLLEGHIETARQETEQFNAAHTGSAEGLYLEGEVLLRGNRAKESLQVFTKAASIQTPSGAQLRLVGLDYVLLNDYPDALRWLESSVRLAPGDAENWYALGRALYSTGNFHGAEVDLIKASTLAPASAKVLDNLGLTYVAEGELEKGLGAYRRAISVKQSPAQPNAQPLLDYGTLLMQMGDTEAAQTSLTEAIKIAPECAPCHETLGRALLANHHPADAAAQLETAVKLQPENPRYHFQLGRIYKASGNQVGAAAEFDRSAKLYGSHSTSPN